MYMVCLNIYDIGEPSVLGLTGNAVCALVASWIDFDGNSATANVVYSTPTYLLFGFLLQLIAALACFRKNDRLGSTAFTIFALFWVCQHHPSAAAKLIQSAICLQR
jgi:succinate-acetate transporter protein